MTEAEKEAREALAVDSNDEREALDRALDSIQAPAKACQEDGCQHYARYLDSGDRDWCACHYMEELADECEGQPGPLPPYRVRLFEALRAEGFRRGAPAEPAVTDEMVDIIQSSVYDDYREGDRPVIRTALEAVMALLSTERGEWEYGYRLVGDDGNVYKTGFAYDDPRDASERGRARVIEENEVHEANGMPRLSFELIRRRKAGPWEPVTPKGESPDQDQPDRSE